MLPIVYHPNYSCPFPTDHRLVMSKFVDLYQHVRAQGLIAQDENNLFTPQAASLADLYLYAA